MDDDEHLATAILALCDAMEKPTASEKQPLIDKARHHATYVRREGSGKNETTATQTTAVIGDPVGGTVVPGVESVSGAGSGGATPSA